MKRSRIGPATYEQALKIALNRPVKKRTPLKSRSGLKRRESKDARQEPGFKRRPGLKQNSQNEIPKLKRQVWKEFSIYIRRRDTDGHEFGLIRCCTCPEVLEWKDAHAGHALPGRNNSILYDERCVHAQCFTCNIELAGNPEKYELFMLKRYGQEVVDELRALRNQTKKLTADELRDLLYRYKSLNSE